MTRRRVGGIERRSLEVVLGDVHDGMRVKDLVPASIGIEEAPPDIVVAYILHATAAVEEGGQHALAQLDDAQILFGLRRLGGVVGDGVFLGDGWDDEGRVQGDECGSQRSKLAVSSSHLNILQESAGVTVGVFL